MKILNEKDPKSLVYIDEAGINDDEVYPFAWGPKGKRIFGMKKAKRSHRLSIIGALHNSVIRAPFVFEGSCDRNVFEVYVEKVLVPELKPNQTVILDNASFHKGGRISKILENANCEILYLPSYSPDFNPIEHYWSGIKNGIRKALKNSKGNLNKAAQMFFKGIRS